MQHQRSSDGAPPADAARLLAQHSPVPLLLLDASGAITYANPAALEAFGSPDLTGADFIDRLDEGSRAKGRAMLAAALPESSTAYELNQLTDDGHIRTLSYRAVRHDPAGFLLFGQPLTEMVATTERLIALNSRLQALFALTSSTSRSLELADLLRIALQTTLGELNLQAGAVLLLPEAAEAEPLTLHLAAQLGFVGLETLDLARWMAQIRAEGRRHAGVLVADGDAAELGLAEISVPAAISPLWKLASVPLQSEEQTFGFLLLVTDRYRAFGDEELDVLQIIGNVLGPPIRNAALYGALRERSGQLQAVLDNIDGGVLLVDTDGTVRYANPRLGAVFGRDVSAWPGQQRDAVFPTNLAPLPQLGDISEDLWQLDGPRTLVLRRYTDRVMDDNGAPVGSIEVFTDVTELQQLTQLKDEFVAAAAHDLKTPVTAIKGYAQIALRMAGKLENNRLGHQLELINMLSDDLTHLVESLLDVSRLQAGRLALDVGEFDLVNILKRASRHFDYTLQRQHRAIVIDTETETLLVRWDRERMERVLINLLSNAVKYSPDTGDVTVCARELPGRAEPRVELVVTDQGIGIPEGERGAIFDRFYRVREAVEYGFKGTGLGLFICKRIVEMHGGTISAEDARHGGQGTSMVVVLPREVRG